MKYGTVIFAVILACTCITCRSRRSVNRNTESITYTEQKSTTTRTDSVRTEAAHRDSTVTTLRVHEFIRITTLDTLGRVSSVQEQWRQSGSSQLALSTGQSSQVSVGEQKTDSSATSLTRTKEAIQEKSTTDSRPVQGSEWLWLSIGIGIVVIIVLFIVFKKLKK